MNNTHEPNALARDALTAIEDLQEELARKVEQLIRTPLSAHSSLDAVTLAIAYDVVTTLLDKIQKEYELTE